MMPDTFVCDNLAFSADHVVKRKHTANARRRMDPLKPNCTDGATQEEVAGEWKKIAEERDVIMAWGCKTGMLRLMSLSQVFCCSGVAKVRASATDSDTVLARTAALISGLRSASATRRLPSSIRMATSCGSSMPRSGG